MKCIGCAQREARSWALRCWLELQQHHTASFTTLTYAKKYVPVSLDKTDLQRWLKRLRKRLWSSSKRSPTIRTLRFFASGEYGETTRRPHYHAILYGIDATEKELIEETWGLGHTHTDPITPERISYTAGYTAKKTGWRQLAKREYIDPTTGEYYWYQPPFVQMSRQPGIAAFARQWPKIWRDHAVYGGNKMPVPRYLHNAWLAQATEQELQELQQEKEASQLLRGTATPQQLSAGEANALARQALKAATRNYG